VVKRGLDATLIKWEKEKRGMQWEVYRGKKSRRERKKASEDKSHESRRRCSVYQAGGEKDTIQIRAK